MQMIKIFFILTITFLGCSNENNDYRIKSLEISPSELHSKQGDCYLFKDSANNYFIGVLMNFNKGKEGIWYAMCFTNYYDSIIPDSSILTQLEFCGRKVMYYTPGNYSIGFDIDWARDTTIDKNSSGIIGNIDLSRVSNVEIDGEGTSPNFSWFINAFYYSREVRSTPPDRYDDFTKEHLRTEEYFTLDEFKEWSSLFKKL